MKYGSSWNEADTIITLNIEISDKLKDLELLKYYSFDNLGIINMNNIANRDINIIKNLSKLDTKNYFIKNTYIYFYYENIKPDVIVTLDDNIETT